MTAKENWYPNPSGMERVPHQFKTSIWLHGAMVSILRQYFGSADRMTLEKGSLLWDPDVTKSKVVIDTADNLKFQEGDKFPKFSVELENQTFPKDVIGDMVNYNGLTGDVEYNIRVESAFLVQVWAHNRLECWNMMDELRVFLSSFCWNISACYGFQKFRPIQVNKPVKSQLHDDYWIGRVIIEFSVDESWAIGKESLEASAFNVKMTTL